jgi:hypothetical protein
VKYAWIAAESACFAVARLCELLAVSRSGFYAWRQRPISVRARSDEELAIVLRACHARHRGKYGRPRLTRDLREAGFTVNHKRVRRLMLREGLQARRPRRFVRTTDSRHRLPVAPNLLERDFRASAPNQKWVAEIVCTQMTKMDVFAAQVGGNHIADLDVAISHDHPVDQKFDQLAFLLEAGVG